MHNCHDAADVVTKGNINMFKNRVPKHRTQSALATFALVIAACSVPQFTRSQSQRRNVTLTTGTVIAVRLDDSLSSNESHKGDRFTATVKDIESANALPPGTTIQGIVRGARAKKDKIPGVLDLAFTQVTLPNGTSKNISGSLIGLDGNSVTRDKNGRIVAKKGHRTDRLTFVGYGSGAGLFAGLLTDRKNMVRDTALGAGLGYLYGALEKDKSKVNDVHLKEGTQMGVRLGRSFTYARSQ
jgi:hypothetical protein